MKNKLEKGFTLIELLVVIAIIGILSSVVLASLNTARDKGRNAKIKSQLAEVRSAAEIYLDTYMIYNGSAGDVSGDCTTVDSMFTDVGTRMSELVSAANYPIGTSLTCYSTDDAYAVSASLAVAEDTNTHWCVDSGGISKGRVGVVDSTSC